MNNGKLYSKSKLNRICINTVVHMFDVRKEEDTGKLDVQKKVTFVSFSVRCNQHMCEIGKHGKGWRKICPPNYSHLFLY